MVKRRRSMVFVTSSWRICSYRILFFNPLRIYISLNNLCVDYITYVKCYFLFTFVDCIIKNVILLRFPSLTAISFEPIYIHTLLYSISFCIFSYFMCFCTLPLYSDEGVYGIPPISPTRKRSLTCTVDGVPTFKCAAPLLVTLSLTH